MLWPRYGSFHVELASAPASQVDGVIKRPMRVQNKCLQGMVDRLEALDRQCSRKWKKGNIRRLNR